MALFCQKVPNDRVNLKSLLKNLYDAEVFYYVNYYVKYS